MLAPFGQDNPKPVFEIEYDQLIDVKTMGKTGDHLRFSLVKNKSRLTAVAFGQGAAAGQLSNGSASIKVSGEINENTWNNHTTIQLMVSDLKQIALPIVDERTQKLHKQMFSQLGTYVFFSRKCFYPIKGLYQ